MAVGAVKANNLRLAIAAGIRSHASAHSTRELSSGETSNEMYWTAAEGNQSFVSELVAKPAPQPKRLFPQGMCYRVVWQVSCLMLLES